MTNIIIFILSLVHIITSIHLKKRELFITLFALSSSLAKVTEHPFNKLWLSLLDLPHYYFRYKYNQLFYAFLIYVNVV